MISKEEFLKRLSSRKDIDFYKVHIEEYKNYTKDKITVECNRCGNIYKITPRNFINGQNCLKCSYKERAKKQTLKLNDKIISEVKNNGFSIVNFKGIANRENEFSCNNCNYKIKCTLKLIKSKKFKCPNCTIEKNEKPLMIKRTKEYQDRLNERNIDILICENYFHGNIKLSKFKCLNCNQFFTGYLNNILVNNSGGCPFCLSLNFKEKIDKNLISNKLGKEYEIEWEDTKKYRTHDSIKIFHKKCNNSRFKKISDILYNNQKCPCENKRGFNFDKYEKLLENYNFKLDNKNKNDVKSIDDDIFIKCNKCGNTFRSRLRYMLTNDNFQCKYCGIKLVSLGEKEISEILLENHINFIREKKFPNLKGINGGDLRYDFYLPDFNTVIEYNGKQHYEEIEFFGGNEYFETLKSHDKIKNDYCVNNNINLIVINYKENIYESLSKNKVIK